ncbi:MAG: CoA transferase, partial [Pseudomonadales bacterium]
NIAPYQTFPSRDGHLIVACGNDAQFERLVEVLQLPTLASDARFSSNELRVTHRQELEVLLSERTQAFTRDDLIERLTKAAVPAGPINTVADAFADPQIKHRGIQIEIDGVPSVRTPIRFSDAELTLDLPSPKLGEHTEAVKKQPW